MPHAGFHTFDYARHFLSCCSRMLGLEHVTSRGSIMLEYYGRNVGVKIMPTGVKPERFLSGFAWQDTIWRRGELLSQARRVSAVPPPHKVACSHTIKQRRCRVGARTVLVGVDNMACVQGSGLCVRVVDKT